MANRPHQFLLTLKMDNKIIATRNTEVVEYNEDVIYSLRLNELMTEMSGLITDAMKDKSIKNIDRMLQKGWFR